MHPDNNTYFYHGTVRIYGSSSGVTIKIFVRSTDASRGQQNFRRIEIELNGQYAKVARRIYKVINVDRTSLRAQADENAQIRTTLVKGAFVKTMHIQGEWEK